MKNLFEQKPSFSSLTNCGAVVLAMAMNLMLANADATGSDSSCRVSGRYPLSAPDTKEIANVFNLDTRLHEKYGGSTVGRDASCYIKPEAVARRMNNGKIMLVDTRSPQDFARYHIPGSLNIAPAQVRNSRFLDSRHVVLVDRGYSQGRLEALCENLRLAGLSRVSILDGGLEYWHRRIAPLTGDRLAQQEMMRIDAREYFVGRRYAHWVVIDLALNESPVGVGGAIGLGGTFDLKVEAIRARLAAAVEGHSRTGRGDPYLLVVTPQGQGFDAVAAAVRDQGPVHTYFLDGGRAAYERFIGSQRAMLSYEHRIPKLRGGCGERI